MNADLQISDPIWITSTFQKKTCSFFVKDKSFENKCQCGRYYTEHESTVKESALEWKSSSHTSLDVSDAYGSLEFYGVVRQTKARYIRLSNSTKVDKVMQLLTEHWGLHLPKLVISVYGGRRNFDLNKRIKKILKKGLIEAAKTTNAWIITTGINAGAIKDIGESLTDCSRRERSKFALIGISPWGVISNRHKLIKTKSVVHYDASTTHTDGTLSLNNGHSHFLLVDDGTVNCYGTELNFRRRLERHISRMKMRFTESNLRSFDISVVCIIVEGGRSMIGIAKRYLNESPPLPVVVVNGSGRAANLISYVITEMSPYCQIGTNEYNLLISAIDKTFVCTSSELHLLASDLISCLNYREHITVFESEDDDSSLDKAILTCLLKSKARTNIEKVDILSMLVAWKRADIARSQFSCLRKDISDFQLECVLTEALLNDDCEYVQLLLENNVSLHRYLSYYQIQQLYRSEIKTPNIMKLMLSEVRKNMKVEKITLFEVGLIIEYLMGGLYKTSFSRRSVHLTEYSKNIDEAFRMSTDESDPGKHPFNELTIWAVLTNRYNVAKFMCRYGEQAISKAIVSCKLYKNMAKIVIQNGLDLDVAELFQTRSNEFKKLSYNLLNYCYREDDELTLRLLTYEMKEWSNHNCLSLAVSTNHRDFIAHGCCQMLITEMWIGGMKINKYITIKVILGILLPFLILFMEFKSREEIEAMPHTEEEYLNTSSTDESDSCQEEVTEQSFDTTVISMDQIPDFTNTFEKSIHFPPFNKSKKTTLKLKKKYYEFYTAPLTKFWMYAIMYLICTPIYSYMCVVKLPDYVSLAEWILLFYSIGMVLEIMWEIHLSNAFKLIFKLKIYFFDFWNICNLLILNLFFVGFTCRVYYKFDYNLGHIFYCIGAVFWYIKLLDIFSVDKNLGPYIMMIGIMLRDLTTYIVIVAIVLLSFGVARYGILHPNSPPSMLIIRDILFQPYFMLYGELFADQIDPECGSDLTFKCVIGRWLSPAIMSLYLIVANILLINSLIAVFNNTFSRVYGISNEVWKFKRYLLTIEYEQKSTWPPPFNIISLTRTIIWKYLRNKNSNKNRMDSGLKLFLSPEEIEKIQDFEEECVDDYYRAEDKKKKKSIEKRIKKIWKRIPFTTEVESKSNFVREQKITENSLFDSPCTERIRQFSKSPLLRCNSATQLRDNDPII